MSKNEGGVDTWVKVVGILALLGCIGIVIWGKLTMGDSPSTTTTTPPTSVSSQTPAKWAQWESDEDEIPNANVLVRVMEAIGDTSYGGSGHIRGGVINNTTSDFSYVQITFGLYSEAGAKFGTCLANMANLGARQIWEFDAYCPAWRSSMTYRIDDVTYW